MDIKKIVLYVLLGVIVFALWQAWQNDYGIAKKPEAAVAAAAGNANTTAGVADKGQNDSDTNIPGAIKNTKERIAKTATVGKIDLGKVPASRIVTVRTDVLEVTIDKKGGNIITSKLLDYKQKQDDPRPVEVLSEDPQNFYRAESGLVSPVGPDTKKTQALYATPQAKYVLSPEQQDLKVTLTWENATGLTVKKNFMFTKGKYEIGVNYAIINNSAKTFSGQFYAELQHKNVEEKSKRTFGSRTYIGAAISSPKHPYEKLSYKKLAEENINRYIQGGWLAVQEHYFLTAWIPGDKEKTYNYFSDHSAGNFYNLGFIDKDVTVAAKDKATVSATIYTGPEIAKNLKALAPHLNLTVDYGWLWIISDMLFWLMQQIYRVVGNWGWTIVLVTVLIKALFYKLSESSFRSMARMKELAPRMKQLKERYGSDKQKLSQATMELYKKEKINPLGGCLPIIIQIPVFIALYYVLIESVQLRQAPFIFWITDLATKDPYYILPILMGISMFVQQKLSPQPADPAQAKMMMFLPVVFTIFFLSFPSGLVLYWLVNNCLTILQQWYINKKMERATQKPKQKK